MTPTCIVVLANSWKHQDWCLAGIETATGKWIRPVTSLDDGRVPAGNMKLGGHWPQLLDILTIPLAATGRDFGFETENRTILPGRWLHHGRADVQDVLRYAKRPRYVLHNRKKYVTVREMQQKPVERRTTLQLIRVDDFEVTDKRRNAAEKHKWHGTVSSGGRKLALSITDPAFFDRLNQGHAPSRSCLLTVSLGMPYKPPDWAADEAPVCWKLIAGVIEIQAKVTSTPGASVSNGEL